MDAGIARLLLENAIRTHVQRSFEGFAKIAKAAGVSAATVKKQFLGPTNIQAETFFRILQAIGGLQIDPDSGTISLKIPTTRENVAALRRLRRRADDGIDRSR